jgi:hypothetical protein
MQSWQILVSFIVLCMKRLLVTIRSSILLMIIGKKHYNYLQAYLQKLQTYKTTLNAKGFNVNVSQHK